MTRRARPVWGDERMVIDHDFHLHLRPLSAGERRQFGAAEYLLEGWVGGQRIAIPVYPMVDPGRASAEGYAFEAMGLTITEGRLADLTHAARQLLHALAYGGQFPCYAMEIPSAGVALPVYPWGEGWRVHVPDGPILEARDLGILRQRGGCPRPAGGGHPGAGAVGAPRLGPASRCLSARDRINALAAGGLERIRLAPPSHGGAPFRSRERSWDLVVVEGGGRVGRASGIASRSRGSDTGGVVGGRLGGHTERHAGGHRLASVL